MPTERFHKLSEGKKQLIIEAAADEFSRVSFEKVSINRIVQEAGISRGSFYTYFEDIKDVLRYVVFQHSVASLEYLKKTLILCGGDLFQVFENIFEVGIAQMEDHPWFQLIRNVFAYESLNQVVIYSVEDEIKFKQVLKEIYQHINQERFLIHDEEEFHSLLELIICSLMFSFDEYKKSPENEVPIRKMFHSKLKILKYGVCRDVGN